LAPTGWIFMKFGNEDLWKICQKQLNLFKIWREQQVPATICVHVSYLSSSWNETHFRDQLNVLTMHYQTC
jgi:hypothetical protein